MVADDDWRLLNAEPHLRGARFRYKAYKQPSSTWDHDDCGACWAKFAEYDGPDILHHGYAVTAEYMHGEDYVWVCPECFDLLKEHLLWSEAPL